jgi:hypothetical protein
MNIKAKGLVSIPNTPRTLVGLLSWSKSVNRALQQLRDRTWTVPRSGGGGRGGNGGACSFGELIDVDDETTFEKGIRGGVVYCGDKNFDVPYQGVNDTDGKWLIFLKLTGIKFNADDDDEIFLPGIKTSTGDPEIDKKAISGESTDYDDNVNPSSPTGSATIYVPLGTLETEDGVQKFTAVGCGNIRITQCGGTVSFERE